MKRIVGLVIMMWFCLSVVNWQLASNGVGPGSHCTPGSTSASATGSSVTVGTSGYTCKTPPANPTHTHGGGGSTAVCRTWVPGASTSVVKGTLTVNYSGGVPPNEVSRVLAALAAYASCNTTAPQHHQVQCMAAVAGPSNCSVIFTTKASGWGSVPSSIPGNPATLINVAGVTKSCEASFNPGVQASKVSITGVNVLPSAKWLLNLPVEYAYSSTAAPTISFQGSTGTSCHVAIGKKISGAVNVGASGLTYSVVPGPATVQMVLYGSNTPVGPSQSCNYHNNALVPPSQIPNYQGNLPAYQSFFQGHRICTFTPSGTSFQSVAFQKQPIQFYITKSWIIHYSYNESSAVSVTQAGHTQVLSNSSAPHSGVTSVTASYRSPTPLRVLYIVGQECSFIRGTVTCPQTRSAG